MKMPEPQVERPDSRFHVVGSVGIGALSLLAANAGVLVFYFIYDITLFQLVLVYWCECLWVGIFCGIKLLVASVLSTPYENRYAHVSRGAAVFTSVMAIGATATAFFSLLGAALLAILMANDSLALSSPGDEMYRHIGLVVGTSLLLLAGHAISFVFSFLVLGEYRRARFGDLLALPFKRCLALLAAILTSIAVVLAVPAIASTTGFAVVIILLKVLWDIRLHNNERRAMNSGTATLSPDR